MQKDKQVPRAGVLAAFAAAPPAELGSKRIHSPFWPALAGFAASAKCDFGQNLPECSWPRAERYAPSSFGLPIEMRKREIRLARGIDRSEGSSSFPFGVPKTDQLLIERLQPGIDLASYRTIKTLRQQLERCCHL